NTLRVLPRGRGWFACAFHFLGDYFPGDPCTVAGAGEALAAVRVMGGIELTRAWTKEAASEEAASSFFTLYI
ncbi:MAG: hypothetical protein WB524_26100, partial [Acidobacteriaceae bacterium]